MPQTQVQQDDAMPTQSDAVIRGKSRAVNRWVGLVTMVIGWTVLAALLIVWLAGGSDADAATVSARQGKVVVPAQKQAAVVKSGKVKVRVKSAPGKSGKQKVQVRVAVEQAWSGLVIAGNTTVKVPAGKTRTVQLKLNAKAMTLVRGCGAPVVRANAKAKKAGKVRAWKAKAQRKLAKQAARCAVPAGVRAQLAKAPACEFIADPANPCLGTFPNNYFTRQDDSSETGLRLNLDPEATPVNKNFVHIGVDSLNTSDGFSAGAAISLKIPGLDNQAAFNQTRLVPEGQMSLAYAKNQPALLIDAETGERQLIWAELNTNAPTDAERTLIVREGKNLTNGKRYIFALRNLKDADGNAIEAPAGFRLYRDAQRTDNNKVESRRTHFEGILRTLVDKAGVDRKSLYIAWDFTVGSTENVTGRMISIRDRAFAELGDTNLTDGTVQGDSPEFTIDSVADYTNQSPPAGDGVENIRTIIGTVKVPCYLADESFQDPPNSPCAPGSTFVLDDDGLPVRTPGSYIQARFKCNIPRSAVYNDGGTWKVDHKVRPSLYGHGLFGSINEVSSRNIRELGTENGVMVCGSDWIGMADPDVTQAARALMDLTRFPALADRLQQGFLDFLYLGRTMIHPDGFASDPNFQFDGESVIDTSDLFYYGNSQGGIAGGALTAVATDFTRSVLYVPAMNYSTLLPRSTDFDIYEAIMRPYYPSQLERPLIFALMQTMWDRGEPNGYANHMTSDPLPGTPEHKVMIMMAYGDHQVTNVATEVEARTIGAPLMLPAVSPGRNAVGMVDRFFQHDLLGDLGGPAADGNAFVVWDIGPKRLVGGQMFGTDPAPLANISPITYETGDPFGATSGIDPHDTVIRSSPIARKQIADFITTGGKVTNPCAPNACWAAGWNGNP